MFVRLWQLPSIKGKVDVEEKGNGCGTADIGKTIGDCIHYIDDISSNRIKDNFSLTGTMKSMQIKIAEVGGWLEVEVVLFYFIYFPCDISTGCERKEWLLEI